MQINRGDHVVVANHDFHARIGNVLAAVAPVGSLLVVGPGGLHDERLSFSPPLGWTLHASCVVKVSPQASAEPGDTVVCVDDGTPSARRGDIGTVTDRLPGTHSRDVRWPDNDAPQQCLGHMFMVVDRPAEHGDVEGVAAPGHEHDLSIASLQPTLGKWHIRTWGHRDRGFMGLKLAEEVGEVCEAVLKDEAGHPKAASLDYGAELADVVIVAICAAAMNGVDLAAEMGKKLTELGVVD